MTEWTLVARLRSGDDATSRRALDDLCAQHHFPLYCFIRMRGLPHHDAQDSLHDFLAKLLRLDAFHDLDAEKGRLRTFLSKSLDRFLITRHRRQAKRRGRELPLEDARFAISPKVERRYEREIASDHHSPEVQFDRMWCEQLLQRTLERLKADYQGKGRADLFMALRPVLFASGSLHGHDVEGFAHLLSVLERG